MLLHKRLLLFSLCAGWLFGATVAPGTEPDLYFIRGTFVTPDEIVRGSMVVRNDTIECIGRKCAAPPGATRINVDDGFIYPGFIDAHQHMVSNIAPIWPNRHTYQDRYQWQQDPDHLAFMAPARQYFASEQGWCDAERFAEIRQLVSGVTTIQGTGPPRPCTHGLIRNADGFHDLPLPPDRVVGYIPDVRLFDLTIDWTHTRCLAIHLGEGIDDYTRQELDILDQKGLLRPETLIIHGTAFEAPEFARMAKAGAKLVWSPQSNIALYGRSMNVEAAIRAGVKVSLGVDWSPSGSHDILAELKVAERVNRDQMHNIVKSADWLPMITSRPADALSFGDYLGRLATGKKADITVLRREAKDPAESLLKSELKDVEMVWVGGRPLYGDQMIFDHLRHGVCESLMVDGVGKSLCISDASAASSESDRLAQIESRLDVAYPQHARMFP